MASSGERDVDRAGSAGRDTFRLRDAILGLALFSIAAAAVRFAWGEGSREPRISPEFVFVVGIALGLLGLFTFSIDAGVRLWTIGATRRRRETGKLVALVVGGPAILLALPLAFLPLVLVAPYAALSWGHERLLRACGVEAKNVHATGAPDDAEPPTDLKSERTS